MNTVDLKIEHALVVTVDEKDTIIYDGCVCVHNGIICAVGTSDECAGYDAEMVIDAQGNMVMPGLINAHTHAGMSVYRGMADDFPLQEWLEDYIFPTEAEFATRENVITGTKLSILEMISSGTTCFADMYYFEDSVAEVCDQMGMRAVLAQAVIDYPAPDFKKPSDTFDFLRKIIPVYEKHPRVKIIPGPHSPYTCSPEVLSEARKIANEYTVPMHIHVAETQHEYNLCIEQHDKTPVENLYDSGLLNGKTIAAHCVYMSEHDREIFVENNVGVVNNAQSNMKLVSGVAPIPALREVDVNVALGTDSVVSNNSLDMFQEMKAAALIHKLHNADATVLPAREIVRMGTIDGARVLGLDSQVGSLEVGKQADMILININKPHLMPLYNVYSQIVYAIQGGDVDTVFIDGECLYQNKLFTRFDVLDIMVDAQIIANKIQEQKKK